MKKQQVTRLALAWALLGASFVATAATSPVKPQEKRVVQPAKSQRSEPWLDRLFRRLGVKGSGVFGIFGVADINDTTTPSDDASSPCTDGSTDPCVRTMGPVGG